MLGIDVVFFLVELIAGLVFSSLALTADAFHMVCLARNAPSWRLQRAQLLTGVAERHHFSVCWTVGCCCRKQGHHRQVLVRRQFVPSKAPYLPGCY